MTGRAVRVLAIADEVEAVEAWGFNAMQSEGHFLDRGGDRPPLVCRGVRPGRADDGGGPPAGVRAPRRRPTCGLPASGIAWSAPTSGTMTCCNGLAMFWT